MTIEDQLSQTLIAIGVIGLIGMLLGFLGSKLPRSTAATRRQSGPAWEDAHREEGRQRRLQIATLKLPPMPAPGPQKVVTITHNDPEMLSVDYRRMVDAGWRVLDRKDEKHWPSGSRYGYWRFGPPLGTKPTTVTKIWWIWNGPAPEAAKSKSTAQASPAPPAMKPAETAVVRHLRVFRSGDRQQAIAHLRTHHVSEKLLDSSKDLGLLHDSAHWQEARDAARVPASASR